MRSKACFIECNGKLYNIYLNIYTYSKLWSQEQFPTKHAKVKTNTYKK